ncbi:protein kinase family protein [Pseudonocardia sp. TRM90224]|uniref:protein kinase family protein n=1 Tax=Pseudonocardia sp. TRM90224 TaxID=2812678 RepID=UPI001E325A84|nr:hypothetical protein [Pseudonocardia sp. TRM90224]
MQLEQGRHRPGPPAPGTFGPYRLQGVIARSATATVHRAIDVRHGGRTVALKLFAPHLSRDPAFQHRFRADMALLSGLRQPHVVPVHSYGTLDGVVYLDMRLIEGPSLAATRREGRLDPRRAATIVEQLAETTDALVTAGFGVRPIAAEDVLLAGAPGREFVHVVGLGLGRATAADPADLTDLTHLTQLVGPTARVARRRWWPIAAVVAVLALVAGGAVWISRPATPIVPPAPGQLLALTADSAVRPAATAVLDGRPVLVGATGAAIHFWDLRTGAEAARPIPITVHSLDTTVIDGDPVVVSRTGDRRIHLHRISDGQELGAPIGEAEPVEELGGVPVFPWDVDAAEIDGRPVVAAVEPNAASKTVLIGLGFRVLALGSGEPVGPLVDDGQHIPADLTTVVIGGRTVVVDRGTDLRLRMFDAVTGTPVEVPHTRDVPAQSVTVVAGAAGPVLVIGGADNTVRAVDLTTGQPVGPVRIGHTAAVTQVAAVRLGDRTVIISVAGDNTVRSETRFWDLESGAQIGPVLTGHPIANGLLGTAEVDGAEVDGAEVDGRAVVVTTATDGAAVWDVAALIGEGKR